MDDGWVQYVAVYGMSQEVWEHSGDGSGPAATHTHHKGAVTGVVPCVCASPQGGGIGQWKQDAVRCTPFVFPTGIWLNDPAYGDESAGALTHSFALTLESAMCLYGHVLTRYHKITDRRKLALLRMQAAARLMAEEADAQHSVERADESIARGTVFSAADHAYEPTAVCILTTEPLYESMRALLSAFDACLPKGARFERSHARILYRVLVGDAVARSHFECARAAVVATRGGAETDGSDTDASDDALLQVSQEDLDADDDVMLAAGGDIASVPSPDSGATRSCALRGVRDALAQRAGWRHPRGSGTSASSSSPQAATSPARIWHTHEVARNELQYIQMPWASPESHSPSVIASPLAGNIIVVPPSSNFSWELPQVEWRCTACKESFSGVTRDFLLSALAASIARRRTTEIDRGLQGHLLQAPLQDQLRCVETRCCLPCTAASVEDPSMGGQSGASQGAGATAASRHGGRTVRRRRGSRGATRSADDDCAVDAPAEPMYDLLDDPLWPYVAPALQLSSGILELLSCDADARALPSTAGQPTAVPPHLEVPVPFTIPSGSGLQPLDVDPRQLFARVQPANIIATLTALLCERNVIVVSKDVSILPDVMTTLLALLHPFEWLGSLIPVFPLDFALLDWLGAPMPKFWGVHSGVAQRCSSDAWWDVEAGRRSAAATGAVPRPYIATECSGSGTRRDVCHDDSTPTAGGSVGTEHWRKYDHIIQAPANYRGTAANSTTPRPGLLGTLAHLASSLSSTLPFGVSELMVDSTQTLLHSTWEWTGADAPDRAAPVASESIGGRGRNYGANIHEKSAVAAIILDLDVDAVSPNYLPPTHLLPPRLSMRLWRAVMQYANLYAWAHPDRPLPPRLPDMPSDVSATERAMVDSIYAAYERRAVARAWDGLRIGPLPTAADSLPRTSVLCADSLFMPEGTEHYLPSDGSSFARGSRHIRRVSAASCESAGLPASRADRAAPSATMRTLAAVHSDDDADDDDDDDEAASLGSRRSAGKQRSTLDCQPITVTPPWGIWRASLTAHRAEASHARSRYVLALPASACTGSRRGSTPSPPTHDADATTLLLVPEPSIHFTRVRLEFMHVMVSLFKAFRTYMRGTITDTEAGAGTAAVHPDFPAQPRAQVHASPATALRTAAAKEHNSASQCSNPHETAAVTGEPGAAGHPELGHPTTPARAAALPAASARNAPLSPSMYLLDTPIPYTPGAELHASTFSFPVEASDREAGRATPPLRASACLASCAVDGGDIDASSECSEAASVASGDDIAGTTLSRGSRVPPPAPPIMSTSLLKSPPFEAAIDKDARASAGLQVERPSPPHFDAQRASAPAPIATVVHDARDAPHHRVRSSSNLTTELVERSRFRVRAGSDGAVLDGILEAAMEARAIDRNHAEPRSRKSSMEAIKPAPFVGNLGPRSKAARNARARMSLALSPADLDLHLRRVGGAPAPASPPRSRSPGGQITAAGSMPDTLPALVRTESAPTAAMQARLTLDTSVGAAVAGGSPSSSLATARTRHSMIVSSTHLASMLRANAVDCSPIAAMASLTRAAQLRESMRCSGSQPFQSPRNAAAESMRTPSGRARLARDADDSHARPEGAAVGTGSGEHDTSAALTLSDLTTGTAPPEPKQDAPEPAAVAEDTLGDIPTFDESFRVQEFVVSESALDAEPLVSHVVQRTQLFRMFIQDRVSRDVVDMFEWACYRRMTYRAWRHYALGAKPTTGCLFKAIRGTLCKNWERRLFELHGNVLAYYAKPEKVLEAAERVRALRLRAGALVRSTPRSEDERAAVAEQLAAAEAAYERLRVRNYRKSFHIVPGRTEVVIPSTIGAHFRTPFAFQLVNPELPPHGAHAPLMSSLSEADASRATGSPHASAIHHSVSESLPATHSSSSLDHVFAGQHRDVLTLCADSAHERRQWILHIKARLRPADPMAALAVLYLDRSHGLRR